KTFYPKKIDGYFPNEDSRTVSVNSTGDDDITFFYNPDLKKKANITVRYVDKDGNDLLNQEIHRDLLVDKYYGFEARHIDGYELLNNEKQGVWLRLGGGEIVFPYSKIETPVETGKVIVNYLDEDGNQLLESANYMYTFGESYGVAAEIIEGYNLIGEEFVTGVINQEETIVNFIYKKDDNPVEEKGKIITKYVDENGKDLVEPKEFLDVVGKDFSVNAETIEGYELTSDSKVTGKVTKEDTVITFTYEKVKEPEVPVEPTEPTEPQEPTESTTSTDTEKEPIKEDKKDNLYQTNHSSNNYLLAIITTALVSVIAFITFKKFKK
ncbi:MucBP domain-containing protein, partial [Enterococcus faecalis]|uniref:MucBP domain-containing protein n=1 Tax=Enterococcus faecalis TaxID=1351 RepID=UPI00232D8A61